MSVDLKALSSPLFKYDTLEDTLSFATPTSENTYFTLEHRFVDPIRGRLYIKTDPGAALTAWLWKNLKLM